MPKKNKGVVVSVTIDQPDYAVLKRLCDLSNTRPATYLRFMLNQIAPELSRMADALAELKSGKPIKAINHMQISLAEYERTIKQEQEGLKESASNIKRLSKQKKKA